MPDFHHGLLDGECGESAGSAASHSVPRNSGSQPNSSVVLAFDQPVPANKRLVVEHASLFLQTDASSSITTVFFFYLILGNGLALDGSPRQNFHFIPVTTRFNGSNSEDFTFGGPLTMYLEAGEVTAHCNSGVRGVSMTLTGEISGHLVDAE